MASELRKTGVEVIGDIPWGTHFCYFYETKQDLLDVLIPYFKTGLGNKEFCLWIISDSEMISVEEATDALRNALPDLDRCLTDKSIEIVGHAEWFLNGDVFDPGRVAGQFKEKLNEALARGYAGMRVNGSPAWLRDAGQKELRKFEEQLDKLFPKERTIASCTYPIAAIAGDEIFDVVRTHQFAIARRQGEWHVIETPELIQATAEIERLNEVLEQRVTDRTKELAAANEKLRRENAERKRAEDALRRSEDHLRLVIDTIPIMAWTSRPDGVVDFLNQPWLDYSGLSLEQYVKDPMGPIHPDDTPRVMEKWRPYLTTAEPYEDEMRVRRADGKYRWFLIRSSPLLDEQGNIIKWFGVSIDIEDRKHADDRLRATTKRLRALSARFQTAKDEEGARIGREIHDELGAVLTSLRWDLEGFDKVISESAERSQPEEVRERIGDMLTLIETAVSTVRRVSSELRPIVLDDLGLAEAIERHAEQFQARTGIVCTFDSPSEAPALGREQSTAVFRIFQEALTNILRYAQATSVDIAIKAEAGEFILTISDNGKGITEAERSGPQSLGLLGMEERADLIGGTIIITGIKGKGTLVTVRVPLFSQNPA